MGEPVNKKQKSLQFETFFMFWDVEATNKRPTEDDIISIGAVICQLNKKFVKLGEFHSFVFTRKTIDPIAETIHHINQKQLLDAPTFPKVIDLLREWILSFVGPKPNSRLILSGHNCFNFDDVMLFCNFKQHRMDYDLFLADMHVFGFLDTLQVLKAWFKSKPQSQKPINQATSKPSFALGHCFQSFCGKPLEGAHNALTDSQAIYDILTSESVSKLFNLNTIFDHIRPKEKHIKLVKKSAGLAFSGITERTKAESLQDSMDDTPVWDDDIEDMEDTDNTRLCLNCMMFFKQTEHLQCFQDTKRCQV